LSRLACWILAVAALGPGAVAASESAVIRGGGLSFPDPFLGLGEALELVGTVDPGTSKAPFAFDSSLEYTWVVYGPVVYSVEEPVEGIRYMSLTFGVVEIREDPSINAAFDADPPNAVVPSAFHDGAALLLGSVTELRIRDIFGIVTATGVIRFEAGNALPLLGESVEWTFNAGVSLFGPEVPSGYSAHWAVEASPVTPVGVQSKSWSSIKSLYR